MISLVSCRFRVDIAVGWPCLLNISHHDCLGARVKKYLDGEWAEARIILTAVDCCVSKRLQMFGLSSMSSADLNNEVPGDGPSRTLLAFMSSRGFVPPQDWDSAVGRALTSK